MADSIVHASLFACLLARMPALRTSLVAFDTAVADLSDLLDDPVDVLFGVQLGGGTDIANALVACQRLITPAARHRAAADQRPVRGRRRRPDAHAGSTSSCAAGVTVVVLLALSDEGAPVANHNEAAVLAGLGAYVTTCTPNEFPDLLTSVLDGSRVVTPRCQDGPMSFGKQSGPPASSKQMSYLLSLVQKEGFTDFREARHPLGLTQRQAGGKFTIGEASALIDRLVNGESAAAGGARPVWRSRRLAIARPTTAPTCSAASPPKSSPPSSNAAAGPPRRRRELTTSVAESRSSSGTLRA